MRNLIIDQRSTAASGLVRAKLEACGGRATVHTLQGKPCRIWGEGEFLMSDKLTANPPYTFAVFDVIVELLRRQGGTAPKGTGKGCRLGHPECDESTVVGTIAKYYSGKKDGDAVQDPVPVLAAVMEWAGIAENGRGSICLTPSFWRKL